MSRLGQIPRQIIIGEQLGRKQNKAGSIFRMFRRVVSPPYCSCSPFFGRDCIGKQVAARQSLQILPTTSTLELDVFHPARQRSHAYPSLNRGSQADGRRPRPASISILSRGGQEQALEGRVGPGVFDGHRVCPLRTGRHEATPHHPQDPHIPSGDLSEAKTISGKGRGPLRPPGSSPGDQSPVGEASRNHEERYERGRPSCCMPPFPATRRPMSCEDSDEYGHGIEPFWCLCIRVPTQPLLPARRTLRVERAAGQDHGAHEPGSRKGGKS